MDEMAEEFEPRVTKYEVLQKEEYESRFYLMVQNPITNSFDGFNGAAPLIKYGDHVYEKTGWNSDLDYIMYREVKKDEFARKYAEALKNQD